MEEGGFKALLFSKGQFYEGSLVVRGGRFLFTCKAGSVNLQVHSIYKALTDNEKKLEVYTVTFKYFFFVISGGARKVLEELDKETNVRPSCPIDRSASNESWFIFDPETEYVRVFGKQLGTPGNSFRFTGINARYSVCPTYPFLMVVPSAVSDDVLLQCARFRAGGRLPAVCWRGPNGGAALARCAQPLVGMGTLGMGGRSVHDEQVLEALRQTGKESRKGTSEPTLHIVDCRPLLNAQANKMTGGGTENMSCYPGCVLEQLDLVNIHKVRDSFDALHHICCNAYRAEHNYTEGIQGPSMDDGRFLLALHETKWLHYVAAILKGAMRVASLLRDGQPVLVHCLSPEHEVLTSRGFLGMKQVEACFASDPDFQVAGYDVKTKRMVMEKPLQYVEKPAHESMVSFEDKDNRTSIVVTNEHDMYVSFGGEGFKKMKASELLKRHAGEFYMLPCPPLCGFPEQSELPLSFDAWSFGMWLTKSTTITCALDVTKLSAAHLTLLVNGACGVLSLRETVEVQILNASHRDLIVHACCLLGLSASYVKHLESGWLLTVCPRSAPFAFDATSVNAGRRSSSWCLKMPSGFLITRRVVNGTAYAPVVVGNCSDGWDRTPQVCSLAQIILDPFYRTRQGIAILICKEWISFGHKFSMRSGQHTGRDMKEFCPVFLQWVDCLFQIARRFPSEFDLNSSFLVALVDGLYNVDSATFLCDNERDSLLGLYAHNGSVSLWQKLVYGDAAKKKYGNPGYAPTDAQLFFKPFSWSIKLFETLYMRSIN